MESQGPFVPNLNCKSAAFASSDHIILLTQLYSQGKTPETSTPSRANFVNIPSSNPNEANEHAGEQGIDYQGDESRFPERRSFSTITDDFLPGEAQTTGDFAPPASNGLDNHFRPLSAIDRQHAHLGAKEVTDTLDEPGYRAIDEYVYDAIYHKILIVVLFLPTASPSSSNATFQGPNSRTIKCRRH